MVRTKAVSDRIQSPEFVILTKYLLLSLGVSLKKRNDDWERRRTESITKKELNVMIYYQIVLG